MEYVDPEQVPITENRMTKTEMIILVVFIFVSLTN